MIEHLADDVRQQWRDSRILRQGVWGIAIVLLLYGVLWLDDQVALENLSLQRAVNDRAELQLIQRQQHWPALLAKLEEQREQWLQHTWEARTVGLARSQVQGMISREAQSSEVGDLEIRRSELAQPQPFSDNLHEMRGRLDAVSTGSKVPWDWIDRLERHSPWIIIDSVQTRVGNRSGVAVTIEFRAIIRGLEDEA